MNRFFIILIFFIIFIILLFFSCLNYDSVYFESQLKKAMLTGRVISEEGLPLEGVDVKLKNFDNTKTDINGRFLYSRIVFGNYKMTFEKEGYLKEEYRFTYDLENRKLPFVKIKMYSTNYLINEGFEYLKEKNYDKVEKTLDKLEKVDKDSEVTLYLKAIYFYIMKEYERSLPILENLKELDRKNIYYQLTLIDVYDKLYMFDKQAKLSLYVGRSNPKEYLEYIKNAADIYKDKLKDSKTYEELIKEYETYLNEKNKTKE